MKAEIVETKKFKPVTVQLTFETQAEFDAFYAVVNIDSSFIWETIKDISNSATECDWSKISSTIYHTIKKLK